MVAEGDRSDAVVSFIKAKFKSQITRLEVFSILDSLTVGAVSNSYLGLV